MGCHLPERQAPSRRRRIDSVFEMFPDPVPEKRRDLASQMSGGQQQMLALGRGLMASPGGILLLDEPTHRPRPHRGQGGLPEGGSEINHERLKTTVFVVEHNIKGVLNIADRAYVLNQGRVVHDGTPATVQETDILTQVFLGRLDSGQADE